MSEEPKPLEGTVLDELLPERHRQSDLFICDVGDAVLKDLIPQLEHPFYNLSKKPDKTMRRYEHEGHWIEVHPSNKGQATIYDKDILIFIISKLMGSINKGEKVSRNIVFNPRDFLVFANRNVGGSDYLKFEDALDRLMGTYIKTNITTARDDGAVPVSEEESIGWFHLIESARLDKKSNLSNNRITAVHVTISEWVFNSIRRNAVLTLNRDYFRIKKPFDRRVYELARKHCGSQQQFEIGLEKLQKKSGSRMPLKRFRLSIRQLVEGDYLPDYHVRFDGERDVVTFVNKGTVRSKQKSAVEIRPLNSEVYDEVRRVAPGWDPKYLEQEWRNWSSSIPDNPEAAFIGFSKNKFEREGRP